MILILLILLLSSSTCYASEVAIETIAYEASNQSFEAQVMVASVIKTRMAERGQTAIQVCLAKHQFSAWHPVTHLPTQKRRITPKERELALLAWNEASVGEYNHYARHDCQPYWIKSAKKSVRIGDHVFYKL